MNKLILALVALLGLASCLTSVKTKKPIVVDPVVDSEVIIVESKTFHTEVKYDWAIETVRISNCVLNHPDFKKRVEAIDKFDYSDLNGVQVYAAYSNGSRVGLRVYKSKNPWSKAIATTYGNDKEFFYLNTRKNPRDYGSMVNTSLHEAGHLKGFSHGDNSSVGKENSVNYKVGSIAQEVSAKCLRL